MSENTNTNVEATVAIGCRSEGYHTIATAEVDQSCPQMHRFMCVNGRERRLQKAVGNSMSIATPAWDENWFTVDDSERPGAPAAMVFGFFQPTYQQNYSDITEERIWAGLFKTLGEEEGLLFASFSATCMVLNRRRLLYIQYVGPRS